MHFGGVPKQVLFDNLEPFLPPQRKQVAAPSKTVRSAHARETPVWVECKRPDKSDITPMNGQSLPASYPRVARISAISSLRAPRRRGKASQSTDLPGPAAGLPAPTPGRC